MKKIHCFLSENFQFLEVEFSIYLNRHVFVMKKVSYFSWKHMLCVYYTLSASMRLTSDMTEFLFTLNKELWICNFMEKTI